MAVKNDPQEISPNESLRDIDLNEEKVWFEWEAAERSFKTRDKDFWITVIAILVLTAVILMFIKEFFLIIALISVLFLYYVLSTVPPRNIKNKITNRAVYFGELRYEWELLLRFWFKSSLNSELLQFETNLRFPRQISLVIDPKDKEKIKTLIVKRIPMLESSPTFVDKVSKWFADRLPLENKEEKK